MTQPFWHVIVPEELKQEFRDAIKGVYSSQSDALRDLARQFIRQQQALKRTPVEVMTR